MSRIGKQIIEIPTGTTVSMVNDVLTVKGKNGELSREIREVVTVTITDNTITVTPNGEDKFSRSMWGTTTSLIKNMVVGVNEPFVKTLVVEGVGYKVALAGKKLTLNVGFSHPVDVEVPEGIEVTVEKNEIKISSIDKEKVGQFASEVRDVKKPESYKGKGIRYSDEVVRRKQGKRAVA